MLRLFENLPFLSDSGDFLYKDRFGHRSLPVLFNRL